MTNRKLTRTHVVLNAVSLVVLVFALAWPFILSHQNKKRISNLYVTKANVAMRDDRFAMAVDALEKVSEADPNDPKVQTQLLKARIFRISEKYDVLDRILDFNELDKAEADWARLIEADRQSAELVALRGIIYAIRDNPEMAFVSYKKAAELDRRYANVSNYWGYTAYQWEYPIDMSVKKFREAIELDPNYVMPRINLALVAIRQEKFEDAISILSDAEKITNDNEKLYLLWGACLLNWGEQLKTKSPLESERKFFDALDKFRIAESLKSDTADLHLNEGVTLAALGREREAADEYRKAIDLEPDFLVGHENLSQLLYRRKDREGALGEIRQSLRIIGQTLEQFESRAKQTRDPQAQKILAQWIEERKKEKQDLGRASVELDKEIRSAKRTNQAG